MKILLFAVLILIVLWFVNKITSKFKFPKVGSLVFVSGAVKSGKSTFSVGLLMSRYRSIHRHWKIRTFFCKILKKPLPEEPLIYSNIPLKVPYVKLTEDLLFRKKRFRFGSVIFIDEATLLADSQLIKDSELNERLTLFNKLIGHELKGGLLIYNSQTIADVHYSVKRSLGAYFYTHHVTSWLPFFNIIHVRECLYSDDNTSLLNVVTQDAEMDLRKVLVRKSTWKKFDAYAFSSFTDDLPVEDNVVTTDDLKVRELVSFRDFQTIDKKVIKKLGNKNEKK